jgi:DNA invertase Pin-like site-specific DNA recombinase
MTKAFSYLRVSGDGQLNGDGFTRQRETIQKYAEAHSIEIVEEFREEGVPGKTELQNRPALAALMAAVESNGVRLVIIEIPDRLARDTVVSEVLIREFQKSSTTVISASGNVDLTAGSDQNPTARFIRQVLAAVAELDKSLIVLKTRAARERLRAKNGKCEGRHAYGMKPGEKEILARIIRIFMAGYSAKDIAQTLNREGIRTRYDKPWNTATVWKIIRRQNQLEGTLTK